MAVANKRTQVKVNQVDFFICIVFRIEVDAHLLISLFTLICSVISICQEKNLGVVLFLDVQAPRRHSYTSFAIWFVTELLVQASVWIPTVKLGLIQLLDWLSDKSQQRSLERCRLKTDHRLTAFL